MLNDLLWRIEEGQDPQYPNEDLELSSRLYLTAAHVLASGRCVEDCAQPPDGKT
jgi:hypothetical protein